jgi:predicted CXXCH cytochrome family protein
MKTNLTTITRNKKGEASLTTQEVTTETLRIGRGADCKLHLQDARVSLFHAEIICNFGHPSYIEARGGTIRVDGETTRATTLKPGQHLLIGPFEIIVLPDANNIDIALSIELVDPLSDDLEAVQSRINAGLASTWLSKRAFSWIAAISVLLIFLAWPVWHALEREKSLSVKTASTTLIKTGSAKPMVHPDGSWDVGPLSSAHASFGSNCGACHQQPFKQVQNQACEDCHKKIGWHFALDTPQAKKVHNAVFSEAYCGDCHRDHKGPMGLIRGDSKLCTDCHANLKSQHPQTGVMDVADFGKDHPPFKVSMLLHNAQQSTKAGEPNVHIERIAQTDKARYVESSGLKFPHDVHVTAKGVRSPSGRVQMDCKNCHEADETGTRFKPTTMAAHCQSCHSLEFEPEASSRQVPHGKIADVIATVREHYGLAALGPNAVINVPAAFNAVAQQRSKAESNVVAPPRTLAWANSKATKIIQEIFEVRLCFTCHEITKTNSPAAGVPWQIKPIVITQHWLPKSRFPHTAHATQKCSSCHDVEKSKLSTEIAIPKIENCRECHSGTVTTKDKAPGTCETCHGFHTGSPKAGVPPILPGANHPARLLKVGAGAGTDLSATKPEQVKKP